VGEDGLVDVAMDTLSIAMRRDARDGYVRRTMIFIYSIGYMHGDPRYPRFFAYSRFRRRNAGRCDRNNLMLLYVCWSWSVSRHTC